MAAMLERIEKPGMTTRDILLELRMTSASLLPFQVC
jgi:hypothetical protein